MSTPYLTEIRIFTFNFAPQGWAMCNGQLLPINQNQALFALLGTTYGGNGTNTFALPNLQGMVPMHMGNGMALGQTGGEATHVLSTAEIPSHTHTVMANSSSPSQGTPSGNLWAAGNSAYNTTADTSLSPSAISTVGGQAHENRSPYLTLNFCIAMSGIFPTRN